MKEFAERIIKIVSEYYGVTPEILTAKTNRAEIVAGRHIAVYFCRLKTDLSLAELAELFNYGNHSGTIFAFKSVRNRRNTEYSYRLMLEDINDIIDNITECLILDNYQENDFYV